RYGERLEEQQHKQQQLALPAITFSDMNSGHGGAPVGGRQYGLAIPGLPATRAPNVAGVVVNHPTPTGLTSLDIEMPIDTARYQEFLFTTPRGDLTITSRPLSQALATRFIGLAWLIVAGALVWGFTRRSVTGFIARCYRSPSIGVSLMASGAVLLAFLPLLGLLLFLLGVGSLVDWFTRRAATA
ncbi:MAG: hypothetical protein WBQ66_06740, partial [Blastocatellia bacterium]